MSTNAKPPSAKQLHYLRSLAMQRGESFGSPSTAAQAHAEIDRLLGRKRSSATERRVEREEVSRAMAARGDAASVRDAEIVGYGSNCRWR
ncbi:MAG TPA: hypothetical protein VFI09_09805 [Solirubrobacterales bacterium]|nr:hypothetical protein [Solirubrobacterales bacterium]